MMKATEEPGHTRARNRFNRGRRLSWLLCRWCLPSDALSERDAALHDEGCLIQLWMPLFFLPVTRAKIF